ncbi:bifunctional phosphoglucose/phosphomannose isomerase [Flavobacteriales bacterium]|nr:bifunctional phosphoglucose/phosphomannose isomerase [Flavobacteriales bacterium]
MKLLIDRFPEFLSDAISIGEGAQLSPLTKKINNIVITGLGGSGIGGTIISQLVAHELNVPVVIHKNYGIPNFVDHNTLLIGCSYSGNTEETLNAIDAAKSKGAQIACITSGGQLEALAKDNQWNCILVPGGNPPRAMLAYSLTQLFFLFVHYGLINSNYLSQIKTAQKLLLAEKGSIINLAKTIVTKINGKRIVAYGDSVFAGVIERFRQQLNENSKQLAWHHALPEMNHNELVGWGGGDDSIAVLIFRSDFDNPRTKIRMDLSQKIFKNYTPTVLELNAKGANHIEQAFYHILLGDWISILLAESNDVDPIEIKVIEYLKSELAKV